MKATNSIYTGNAMGKTVYNVI